MNFIKFLNNLDKTASQNGGGFRPRFSKLLTAESNEKENFYSCVIESPMFVIRMIINSENEIKEFSIDLDEKTGFLNTIVKYPATNFEIYNILKEAVDNKIKFEFDLEDIDIGGIPLNKKVIFKFTIEDEEGSKFNEGDILKMINYDHDKNKIYLEDAFGKYHSFVMKDATHFWGAIFEVMN